MEYNSFRMICFMMRQYTFGKPNWPNSVVIYISQTMTIDYDFFIIIISLVTSHCSIMQTSKQLQTVAMDCGVS